MSGEHAVLAPSASPQWAFCSGSVRAQSTLPNLDSEETRAGTAAHWVMAEKLVALRRFRSSGMRIAELDTSCAIYLGGSAPNGVVIDEEMIEGAQTIVDDVVEVCERFDAWKSLLVEFRVHMPEIHEQNWGTLDVALYIPARRLLFLWDYKHGHRECRAENNFQLIDYLAGLIEAYKIDGGLDQGTRVVARIVQPFCYRARGPIDEWTFFLAEIRAHINQLTSQAHDVFNNPTLTTGPWCRDCRAVLPCSAARRAGYNFVDLAKQPYAMDAMSSADLAVEHRILKAGLAVGKARFEAIEDELKHRIKDGDVGSGLVLETGLGRTDWTVPPAQAIALAAQFGVDIAVVDALTPTQTKAKAPAKVRPLLEEVLKSVTRRPAGSLNLVPAENSIGARAFKRKD